MDNIDQLVKQVLIVDDSKDPASIRRDLEYTQNVEATLNRIFDGEVNTQYIFSYISVTNPFNLVSQRHKG